MSITTMNISELKVGEPYQSEDVLSDIREDKRQEMKQHNWKDVYEWFAKIINSDAGKIENLSDKGYDNWLLSLFYLAGVDKIDPIMRKKEGVFSGAKRDGPERVLSVPALFYSRILTLAGPLLTGRWYWTSGVPKSSA